jgi:rfaE bifunctional protein kinase chain/domain
MPMNLDIIKSFKVKKILLVGDTILDIYIYGNTIGLSPDAPAPELEEKQSKVFFGGNGLVASHILELGGELTFVTVLGTDEDARHYHSWRHPKLKKIFLTDPTRKTTVKRRWYDGLKKLLQVNKVDNHYLNANLEAKILKLASSHIKNVDTVVVMDPQHGVLTKNLIKNIVALSHKHHKPLYVDVQVFHRPGNHHWYKGADTIFLNENEARAVYPKFDPQKLEEALLAIKKKLKPNNVVVKLGSRGSAALWGKEYIRTDPHKVKAVDVCGAGDAFLAAFSLGDRSRPAESLKIANTWGALSTAVHGTIPPRKTDLIRSLRKGV